MPAPDRLLESAAFAVLADGDELIARPALAALFASRFGPEDEATLVIAVDDARTDATMSGLQAALDAAGLRRRRAAGPARAADAGRRGRPARGARAGGDPDRGRRPRSRACP